MISEGVHELGRKRDGREGRRAKTVRDLASTRSHWELWNVNCTTDVFHPQGQGSGDIAPDISGSLAVSHPEGHLRENSPPQKVIGESICQT